MMIASGAIGAALTIAALWAPERGARGMALIFGFLFLCVFWCRLLIGAFS